MQFTCQQHDLARGLSVVNHAVSSKSTLPILANILLVAEEGQVTLTTSTAEMSIVYRMDAHVERAGTTTVPAKLFSDYVASLPASPVTMTLQDDGRLCHLTCQRSRATLHSMDPAEFPQVPHAATGQFPVVLDTVMLKEVIEQVCFAASDDLSRPVFTGVQITLTDGTLQWVAADSFRLAVRTLAVPEDRQSTWLVPATALKHLSRILPATGAVQMMVTPDEHQIIFHTERVDLTTRILDARFPDFTQIIPPTYDTRAVVQTQDLEAAIRSVLPFARGNTNLFHLTISGAGSATHEPHTVTLSAAADAMGSNVSVVAATVFGPDVEVRLNVKYLDDVLPVMDMPQIALEVTTPTRPVVLKPALGPTDYHYLLMPMTTTSQNHHPAPAAEASHAPVAVAR